MQQMGPPAPGEKLRGYWNRADGQHNRAGRPAGSGTTSFLRQARRAHLQDNYDGRAGERREPWERSERNYGSGSGNPSRPAVATVPVSERCERVAGTRRRSWKWVHPTYNRGTSWHSAEQAEAEALEKAAVPEEAQQKGLSQSCHQAATLKKVEVETELESVRSGEGPRPPTAQVGEGFGKGWVQEPRNLDSSK